MVISENPPMQHGILADCILCIKLHDNPIKYDCYGIMLL